MNTSQLQCCISCDLNLQGRVTVCAADQLPQTLNKFPCGFIVNTDVHTEPGTHWCAFYFENANMGEFFDTFGRRPEDYGRFFVKFSRQHSAFGLKINAKRLQSDFSNVCGLYCLFYLHQRFSHVSMERIVKSFVSNNFYYNDMYVYQIISHSYIHCIRDDCVSNQSCKPILSRTLL